MTNMLGHVENPSAKIQFTQVTRTAPGQCAICGNGQDKNGFVDTGLDFDFWGRVFFCMPCTLQIAAVFGFISPLDYADLEAELDYKKLEMEKAQERITLLEGIVDGVNGLRTLIPLGIWNTEPGSVVPTEPVTNNSDSDGSTDTPESEPIQPSSGPDKSTSGESGTTTKFVGKQRLLNI